MKTNKITSYMFQNSDFLYNKENRTKGKREIENCKRLEKIIEKHPIKTNENLSSDEFQIFQEVLKNLNPDNKVKKFFEDRRKPEFFNSLDEIELYKQNLEKFPIKIRRYDFEIVNKIFLQQHYNKIYAAYRKIKINLDNGLYNFHERINHLELKDLNKKIEEMNEQGWFIKQIEGIQSGYSFAQKGGDQKGGSGYGFGFTEGLLIFWEKL